MVGYYRISKHPGGLVASQTFSYRSDLDLNFGVKSIVEQWNSGSWENYGFIVRQDPSQEFLPLPNNQITLKYFSVDTHTIYPPQLEFKWDDFKWETGSLSVITGSNIYASLDNNQGFSLVKVFNVLELMLDLSSHNVLSKHPLYTLLNITYQKGHYMLLKI
jgi:hypothetical protein